MSIVSIIVPIYNAAETLERCLDSIQSQSFCDFEVLLINDGSTDNSAAICTRYCQNDARFKLITLENSGPSVARNTGIDNAVSKYLYFVDSDDYIEANTIEAFYNAAEESQADITFCGFIKHTSDQKEIPVRYNIESGVYSGMECRKIAIDAIDLWKSPIYPYSWIRFVRRECLENPKLRFNPSLRRSEDYLLWAQVFFNVNRVCVLADKYLYHYIENKVSITHSYLKDYWQMVTLLHKQMHSTLPSDKDVCDAIDMMLIQRAFIAFNVSAKAPTKEQFLRDFDQIFSDEQLRKIVKAMPFTRFDKRHQKFFFFLKFRLYGLMRMIYAKKHRAFLNNPGLLMYR